MNILLQLAIISGLIQLVGYWIYFKKTESGRIRPNTSMWLMWAFGSSVDLWAYGDLTEWKIEKDLLPAVCAVTAVIVFLVCLKRGRFKRLEFHHWALFLADVAITILYVLSGDPIWATIFFQASTILGFVWTVREVRQDPTHEHAAPWGLWATAYAIQTYIIYVSVPTENWWAEFLYPTVNLFLHGLVGLLAIDWVKKTRQAR